MREMTEFMGREVEEENIYHKSVQESAQPKTELNIKKHISLHNLSHFCHKKGQKSKTRHKTTINAAIYMHHHHHHHYHQSFMMLFVSVYTHTHTQWYFHLPMVEELVSSSNP